MTRRFARELIGNPDCPLIHRWTIVNLGPRFGKLMVHRFLPSIEDPDIHDHPRGFVTICVRGGYDDVVPCSSCGGSGRWVFSDHIRCVFCDGRGTELGDRVRAGSIRVRRAEHAHRTISGPRGAWTIVIMGPLRRPWGFWREGAWYPWRVYADRFGFTRSCDGDS